MAPNLTPEEIEQSNARIQEFIRRMKAVPESERIPNVSEKFAGPIGHPVEPTEHDGTDAEKTGDSGESV